MASFSPVKVFDEKADKSRDQTATLVFTVLMLTAIFADLLLIWYRIDPVISR